MKSILTEAYAFSVSPVKKTVAYKTRSIFYKLILTRSQAVARIADRNASQ